MKRKRKMPAGAVAAALPDRLAPHLAVLGQMPEDSEAYSCELKLDGWRLMGRVDGESVRLLTKNGHDWTARLPALRDALAALALPPGWYDGEMIACDQAGKPDFSLLQQELGRRRSDKLVLYLFDLPYFDGYDLRAVPLDERRALLAQVLASAHCDVVRFSAELHGSPGDILAAACAMQLEGVVCKRRDSPYESGRRPRSWRKLKCGQRTDAVIGGYVLSGRGRVEQLLLGVPGEAGMLRYVGSVKAGFTDKERTDLAKALATIETESCPFWTMRRDRGRRWVEPILAADIAFAEWTNSRKLRHPVYKGVKARPAGPQQDASSNPMRGRPSG